MMKKICGLICFVLIATSNFAQDMEYTRQLVKTLSSEAFMGRGYVNKGDSIAARYLSKEMKTIGLKGFSKNYYQSYSISINTFPETPKLFLDGKELRAAKDFIVSPNTKSCNENVKLRWIKKNDLTNSWALSGFMHKDHSNVFLAIDTTRLNNSELFHFAQTMMAKNIFDAKGMLIIKDKLKFSARTKTVDYPMFMLKSDVISPDVKEISYEVKSQFIEDYKTQNLIAYIPGEVDSCIMYSAHYDHLGFMGDKMYPGANDNASGVAMVLNLARHFKSIKKKPYYTLVFALFSAEEAGLKGATYYTENPLIPLKKTKMLFNFDMVGTGSEGLYLINGKMVPKETEKLNTINRKKKYVFKMHATGESPSSDHAPFHDKAVKSIFFYTEGDNADYHETTDTADKIPYTQFEGLFKLVRDYTEMENK